MDRIVVYVDENTKNVVKDIINNPHSPYKTFADYYRKAIWHSILKDDEYITLPYRPKVVEIPYERPMTTGDIVDVFLFENGKRTMNAREICDRLGVEYNQRKKRFHSRMKELKEIKVVYCNGLSPTKIKTSNGVTQTRRMNYYGLNYNNKYVKNRIKILKVDNDNINDSFN